MAAPALPNRKRASACGAMHMGEPEPGIVTVSLHGPGSGRAIVLTATSATQPAARLRTTRLTRIAIRSCVFGKMGTASLATRISGAGQNRALYRARVRHTWSVNLPVFFPMPEGREFPDPPRCAFCDELGRPIRPEPPETADLPRLVAGPGLFICERCVRLCTEIFEEDDLAVGD
jgi:ClpX C4-type zinc finger protein